MKAAGVAGIVAAGLLGVVAVPVALVAVLVGTLTSNGGGTCGPAAPTADGSPTILGPATLTAGRIVGWWQASGHGPSTPVGPDIATLAGWYIDHGTAEGVRGDYAFAQAAEETTWAGVPFNSPAAHRYNFAGIGITGPGVNGYDYPNPETGVIAQLQLLKEVAAGNNAAFAEPRVAPTWAGRPAATWAGLAGNWAAATNYWDNIRTIYAAMAAGQSPPGAAAVTLVSATASCGAGQGVALPSGGPLGALWAFLAAQLGKPYQWGGTGPDTWDCSGLTMVAWAQVGVTLPRTAAQQYSYTQAASVPLAAIQPGDLVFWAASGGGIDHVAIYIGNGQVLDAPHTGATVQIQPLWTDGLFGVTRPAAGVPPAVAVPPA
jgi:cell wall-associated NlpC family hydrolase